SSRSISSRQAARSSGNHYHFPTPRFGQASPLARRLTRLGALTLALASLAGGVGLVMRKRALPSPQSPLENAMLARGFDLSHYQGQIDWPKVLQAKPDFVFMKATEGRTLVDADFQRNWSALAHSGVTRGAYHFFRPEDDAVEQARWFLGAVKLGPDDLPAVLDVEVTDGKPSAQIIAGVKQWMELVETTTGRRPILYSDTAFWKEQLGSGFVDHPLWLAGEPSAAAWSFWQLGDVAHVDGISGCVDQDVFQGSGEDLRQFVKSGQLPKRGTSALPPSPGRCHRPTVSPEPAVPTRLPTANATPESSDAGTPTAPSGMSNTEEVQHFQQGMLPQPPQLVQPGSPLQYTSQALSAGVQGMAVLMCTIQVDGKVTDCSIVKGLPDLNDALIRMMQSRVYQPMTFQGKIVAVRYAFYLNVQAPLEGAYAL
ncbi:MAG TPA: TonB family protein, partial [Myxococcus sp.]|nr:TonB family protein [Myxococcus sp.]